MKRLLLLSGPIASGKTSVSSVLQRDHGFLPISSGSFLREKLASESQPPDRYRLQELGDSLDKATDFSWLIESVAKPAINSRPDVDNWLLDAVRKPRQVELFRHCFTDAVMHVHLEAEESVLQKRYVARGSNELSEYLLSTMHPNEICARSLVSLADKVLDTEEYSADEIAFQIMALLGS